MRRLLRSASQVLCVAVLTAGVVVGCTDEPTHPRHRIRPPGETAGVHTEVSRFVCTVVVAERRTRCEGAALPGAAGALADRVIGRQNEFVRLATTSFEWDAGTRVLTNRVAVQNLLQSPIGTPDGNSTTGVYVFFAEEPTATGGGTVTLLNPDGRAEFTEEDQPFFHYPQILQPYEISASKPWLFELSPEATSFTFTVFVSTDVPDEDAPLLDAVWTGEESSVWETEGNWADDSLPSDTAIIAIPDTALIIGDEWPILGEDVVARGLRVGTGATLNLANHTMELSGNVDVLGAVIAGTVRLTGASALLGGALPAVEIPGAARLQRPTVTTGPVSVEGTLTVSEHPLTIAIP